MDFALLVSTSVNPEVNDKWLMEFISNYWQSFNKTCQELGLDSPFNFDDFRSIVFDKGFLIGALFLLITYKMLAGHNTSIKHRFIWLLHKIMKANPQYF